MIHVLLTLGRKYLRKSRILDWNSMSDVIFLFIYQIGGAYMEWTLGIGINSLSS